MLSENIFLYKWFIRQLFLKEKVNPFYFKNKLLYVIFSIGIVYPLQVLYRKLSVFYKKTFIREVFL